MADWILVIGNKNYSSWSLRPWLALKHAGIAFDEVRVALDIDSTRQQLLAHSAAAKVPVLKHGQQTIWDSLAICEYLAELQPSLWPKAAAARAYARSVSAEMHSSFAALRQELPMNCRASGRRVSTSNEARTDVQRIDTIWRDCRDQYGAGGSWLFGDFTIADAMYAPVITRFHTYGVELGAVAQTYLESVLEDPHMLAWYSAAEAESEVIEKAEIGKPG